MNLHEYEAAAGAVLALGFIVGWAWLMIFDEKTPWEMWKERHRR